MRAPVSAGIPTVGKPTPGSHHSSIKATTDRVTSTLGNKASSLGDLLHAGAKILSGPEFIHYHFGLLVGEPGFSESWFPGVEREFGTHLKSIYRQARNLGQVRGDLVDMALDDLERNYVRVRIELGDYLHGQGLHVHPATFHEDEGMIVAQAYQWKHQESGRMAQAPSLIAKLTGDEGEFARQWIEEFSERAHALGLSASNSVQDQIPQLFDKELHDFYVSALQGDLDAREASTHRWMIAIADFIANQPENVALVDAMGFGAHERGHAIYSESANDDARKLRAIARRSDKDAFKKYLVVLMISREVDDALAQEESIAQGYLTTREIAHLLDHHSDLLDGIYKDAKGDKLSTTKLSSRIIAVTSSLTRRAVERRKEYLASKHQADEPRP